MFPYDRPIRLGVLVSGGGTTFQNFVEQIADGRLRAELTCVIADRPGCAAAEKAERAGVSYMTLDRREYTRPGDFSEAVFDRLRGRQVELVVLSGFLSLIQIPEDFRHRVLNIHPSLIPAFSGKGYYGRKVHAAALNRGVKVSGCTVHFADNEYDHGPIILQRCVPVESDDTPETLAARVFAAECEAYPEAIRLFAEGKLRIEGSQVSVVRSASHE